MKFEIAIVEETLNHELMQESCMLDSYKVLINILPNPNGGGG
jgi:hypothetical protein